MHASPQQQSGTVVSCQHNAQQQCVNHMHLCSTTWATHGGHRKPAYHNNCMHSKHSSSHVPRGRPTWHKRLKVIPSLTIVVMAAAVHAGGHPSV
jgi:hypothetical protein